VPDPIATDPIATDPIATDPIATDPIATDPIVPDPIATDPIATDPIAAAFNRMCVSGQTPSSPPFSCSKDAISSLESDQSLIRVPQRPARPRIQQNTNQFGFVASCHA
jgi:hypothetical protein